MRYDQGFEKGGAGANLSTGSGGAAVGEQPWDSLTRDTGALLTYSTTHVAQGTYACKAEHPAAPAAAGQCYTRWDLATPGLVRFRLALYVESWPTTSTRFLAFATSVGICADLLVTTSGRLRLRNQSASTIGETSAGSIATGTWVRVEGRISFGTGAGDGTATITLYNSLSATTPTDTITVTAQNLRGGPNQMNTGLRQSGNDWALWMDAQAVSDVDTAIGPLTVNAAPTVSAGADTTITVGSTWSRTATASDTDGTIASYAWTKISGPAVTLSGAATATLSVTPATVGTYVFEVVATDNGGATASDQVALTVNAAPVTVSYPNVAVRLAGAWVTGKPVKVFDASIGEWV